MATKSNPNRKLKTLIKESESIIKYSKKLCFKEFMWTLIYTMYITCVRYFKEL